MIYTQLRLHQKYQIFLLHNFPQIYKYCTEKKHYTIFAKIILCVLALHTLGMPPITSQLVIYYRNLCLCVALRAGSNHFLSTIELMFWHHLAKGVAPVRQCKALFNLLFVYFIFKKRRWQAFFYPTLPGSIGLVFVRKTNKQSKEASRQVSFLINIF